MNFCVIAIDGDIYDITSFLDDHPGSPETLLEFSGQDCSRIFREISHSTFAYRLRHKFNATQDVEYIGNQESRRLFSDFLRAHRGGGFGGGTGLASERDAPPQTRNSVLSDDLDENFDSLVTQSSSTSGMTGYSHSISLLGHHMHVEAEKLRYHFDTNEDAWLVDCSCETSCVKDEALSVLGPGYSGKSHRNQLASVCLSLEELQAEVAKVCNRHRASSTPPSADDAGDSSHVSPPPPPPSPRKPHYGQVRLYFHPLRQEWVMWCAFCGVERCVPSSVLATVKTK